MMEKLNQWKMPEVQTQSAAPQTFNFEMPMGRYELFPVLSDNQGVKNTTTGQSWTPGLYTRTGSSDNSSGVNTQAAINQILQMMLGYSGR